MASYYSSLTEEQTALIRNAPVFFVATADPHLAKGPHGIGPVNLSLKGGVRLHILSPNRVAFLDRVGSGNETARHSLAGGPITVMVCSFESVPLKKRMRPSSVCMAKRTSPLWRTRPSRRSSSKKGRRTGNGRPGTSSKLKLRAR
jgi:hypothetical protein